MTAIDIPLAPIEAQPTELRPRTKFNPSRMSRQEAAWLEHEVETAKTVQPSLRAAFYARNPRFAVTC